MARRPSLSFALAALIARMEPAIGGAFLDAINQMGIGVDEPALISALSAFDIDAAIRALGIDSSVFSQYVAVRIMAFSEAGSLAAAYIPTADANSVVFRFDMSNPRAERWISENVGQRVSGYVQDQIEVLRGAILDGYSRGQGPETIATRIAGSMGSHGRRTGGIIGLTDPQRELVQALRDRLSSGDPSEMRKVLSGMTLRDHRYDDLIGRHIASGTPVPEADIDKMAERYHDRLLKKRAKDIARTETGQSVMGSRAEATLQALEKEGLPPEAVTKTWRHGGSKGKEARQDHVDMNGKKVQGMNTPFEFSDASKQFALDGVGGAAHDANCRCDTWFSINWMYGEDDLE